MDEEKVGYVLRTDDVPEEGRCYDDLHVSKRVFFSYETADGYGDEMGGKGVSKVLYLDDDVTRAGYDCSFGIHIPIVMVTKYRVVKRWCRAGDA